MKLKTVYICENCNASSPKWMGKCPSCDAWNKMQEDVIDTSAKREHQGIAESTTPLSNTQEKETRLQTNITEFDRVLGGGFAADSLTLLSGEPGIGKSTLTLRICEHIAMQGKNTLYISGEESPNQIGLRAKRLGITTEHLNILGATNLENIFATIKSSKPDFLVIDSIQVMSSAQIPSIAGSINQVRYCTEALMHHAKQSNITVLIIGHVTKDGNLAGPKVLEHLVDAVLLIEGDRYQNLRTVRGLKNRYGSTNEIGIFEMTEKGLMEVADASKLFLEGRKENAFGSAITAVVEGTRPLLLEVQALTAASPFGYPKRAASGYDVNRLQLLLAVIQKHLQINVSDQDVYVNIIGGFKVNDPSTDLAVIMAIISSIGKVPLPSGAIFIGEVGLSGELRTVPQLEKRIREAEKIGFKQIYLPQSKVKTGGTNVIPLEDIGAALMTLNLAGKAKKS